MQTLPIEPDKIYVIYKKIFRTILALDFVASTVTFELEVDGEKVTLPLDSEEIRLEVDVRAIKHLDLVNGIIPNWKRS